MGFNVFKVAINPIIYFGGQLIEGTVTAVVSEETTCREITATLSGKGKVEWTERRNKRTYTYSAEEQYVRQPVVLWHGGSSDNKIHPGTHTFPFVFELPHGLPSSFQDDYGKVYYKVKAVADIPWGFDEVDKAPFLVHHIEDLNSDTGTREPLVLEEEVDGGLCTTRIVSFNMNCDRRGFVPGDKLFLNGTITNKSMTPVEYTGAKLVQMVKFHATAKTRETERVIGRIYHPKLGTGKTDRWHNVPLEIPAAAASGLKHCSIIDVGYELRFTAKFGTCKTATAKAVIKIGSVALQEQLPVNPLPMNFASNSGFFPQVPSHAPEMPSAPILAGDPRIDEPPPYSEIAPPAYEFRPYTNTPL